MILFAQQPEMGCRQLFIVVGGYFLLNFFRFHFLWSYVMICISLYDKETSP